MPSRIPIRAALCLLLIGCLFSSGGPLAAPSPPAEAPTIRVVGWSPVSGDDYEQARQTAIANGLTAAVDQVALSVVEPEVAARAFRRISKALAGRTETFVESYGAISEGVVTGSVYRILVEATVSASRLKAHLETAGVLKPQKQTRPKLLLLLLETGPGAAPPRCSWTGGETGARPRSARPLMEALTEAGFEIVSPPDGDLPPPDPEDPALPADNAALSLAEEVGAGIVILGRVEARGTLDLIDEEIRSIRAEASLRALWGDSGEKAATANQSAVRFDTDSAPADLAALTEAGGLAGAALAQALETAWHQRGGTDGRITLVVGGTRHLGQFVQLRKALGEIAGVQSFRIREMRANEAVIDVEAALDARSLAETLMSRSFEGFDLKLYEVTESELRIEIRPTPAAGEVRPAP